MTLTPKQLGLSGNKLIKDSDPLASDAGDIGTNPERIFALSVKALRAEGHKTLAAELEIVAAAVLLASQS